MGLFREGLRRSSRYTKSICILTHTISTLELVSLQTVCLMILLFKYALCPSASLSSHYESSVFSEWNAVGMSWSWLPKATCGATAWCQNHQTVAIQKKTLCLTALTQAGQKLSSHNRYNTVHPQHIGKRICSVPSNVHRRDNAVHTIVQKKMGIYREKNSFVSEQSSVNYCTTVV